VGGIAVTVIIYNTCEKNLFRSKIMHYQSVIANTKLWHYYLL